MKYAIIESFGLIPELVTFESPEARDTHIRELILRDDTGDLDSWVAATAEGNYNEEEAEELVGDEAKLNWLVGQGFLSDGNKFEIRDEGEID